MREHLARQFAGFIPGKKTHAGETQRMAMAWAALASTNTDPAAGACFVSNEAFISFETAVNHSISPGTIVVVAPENPQDGVVPHAPGAAFDTAPAATQPLAVVQLLFACELARLPGVRCKHNEDVSFALVHYFEKTSGQLAAAMKGFKHARPRTLGKALGDTWVGPALDIVRISSIRGIARPRPLCVGDCDPNKLYKHDPALSYDVLGPTSTCYTAKN